jgi:hypothetical protein
MKMRTVILLCVNTLLLILANEYYKTKMDGVNPRGIII